MEFRSVHRESENTESSPRAWHWTGGECWGLIPLREVIYHFPFEQIVAILWCPCNFFARDLWVGPVGCPVKALMLGWADLGQNSLLVEHFGLKPHFTPKNDSNHGSHKLHPLFKADAVQAGPVLKDQALQSRDPCNGLIQMLTPSSHWFLEYHAKDLYLVCKGDLPCYVDGNGEFFVQFKVILGGDGLFHFVHCVLLVHMPSICINQSPIRNRRWLLSLTDLSRSILLFVALASISMLWTVALTTYALIGWHSQWTFGKSMPCTFWWTIKNHVFWLQVNALGNIWLW